MLPEVVSATVGGVSLLGSVIAAGVSWGASKTKTEATTAEVVKLTAKIEQVEAKVTAKIEQVEAKSVTKEVLDLHMKNFDDKLTGIAQQQTTILQHQSHLNQRIDKVLNEMLHNTVEQHPHHK